MYIKIMKAEIDLCICKLTGGRGKGMYIQIMKAEIDLCICKLTGGLWHWPVDFKNFYFLWLKVMPLPDSTS